MFVAPFFISSSTIHAQENNPPRDVRLGLIQGDVQVRLPGEQIWKKATANSELQQGLSLKTGIGLAEIEFENGATGYAGDNSALDFTELSSSAAGRVTRVTVTQGVGRFYANTRGADTFVVLASDMAVSPQELGDFRMEVSANGTIVRVLEGDVLVTGGNANWTLRKGQTWSMAPGALEAKITEAPILNGLGYWPALWMMPPATSSWLKTPPYQVPIPLAAPPAATGPYVPYGLQTPRIPMARPYPHFPEGPPPFPERPPRFPQ